MTEWTADELAAIAGADDLHIAPLPALPAGHDRDPHPHRPSASSPHSPKRTPEDPFDGQ